MAELAMGSIITASPSKAQSSSTTSPSSKRANLNVKNVVLGSTLFETWYPSFYPEELVGRDLDRLYVCQWCFKYCRDLVPFLAHRKLCNARTEPPPGQLIYSKDNYSIHEVDGEEDQLFSQNLSLFAKLFLDNKSVFFDVASFSYYLLITTTTTIPSASSSSLILESPSSPQPQHQIIGFFSKEKQSWDANNLACILVFPPWQRHGHGRTLISLSYELSRLVDRRIGGPERPLSALGRIGYLKFWAARVAGFILDAGVSRKGGGKSGGGGVTVEEVAEGCWMRGEDVVETLESMGWLDRRVRGKEMAWVVNKGAVREWVRKGEVDLGKVIDEEGFVEGYLDEQEEEG
ncbi:MAG: hypothetical protein Q9220_004441 [cf. Caloplaca sp. 1 TL-2023]